MKNPGSEERYPLLLLYVEENGRKSEFPQRVVFADKGRGKEVMQGAAAIITQWPAQITSCWLTSVALATAFIFLSLLLLLSSLNPMSVPIRPRCTRDVTNYHGNKTILLVKHNNHWSHKQLDILQFVTETYSDFEIKIILLDTTMKNFAKKTTKIKETVTTEPPTVITPYFHFVHVPDFTSTFVKKLNEILKKDQIKPSKEEIKEENSAENNVKSTNVSSLKRIRRNVRFFKIQNSYEDILDTYPNIKEEKTTYKKYFLNTPLQYFWVDLSPDMVLFSVRVLELWQNGGITFYLPSHYHSDKINNNVTNTTFNDTSANKTNATMIIPQKIVDNNVNESRLKLLIASTKFRFEKLTDDLVSIDGQGLHMATKIPCHAFFGEMLLKLQRNCENLTVNDLIQKVLNTFCGRGAVDSDYCQKKK